MRMQNSPCTDCPRAAACGEEMCATWRLWFQHAWDSARYELGVMPPKRRGPKMDIVFEIRAERDGRVLFRGSATQCAERLGMSKSGVMRAADRGSVVLGELRITRLEIAGEEGAENES